MMFSYATDNIQNNNAYPDGNSSTEVFQKLLDGGYCTDPTIFYLPLPGKIKPVPGQKLKPENVGWDVTSGVDSGDSNWVPLLFVTGYKITYASGAPAVPLVKSPNPDSHGVAVFYKGNDAVYRSPGMVTNPDGSISNFIPADFNPKGKTYRQLTPDGPLP
ncbi:MAG TPA: hypothetical protein VGZ93_05280 [Candidatus Methylacidiphilales bacterium]|nr:hypothetical protein [Candidatus Methylacidiphilales bacterium]